MHKGQGLTRNLEAVMSVLAFLLQYIFKELTVCTPRTDQHIVVVIAVYVSTFCLYGTTTCDEISQA